jgi:hypothetical protein
MPPTPWVNWNHQRPPYRREGSPQWFRPIRSYEEVRPAHDVCYTPALPWVSMPTDWEAILRSWVKPPSDHEDSKRGKTEDEIKTALNASALLKPVTFKVYAKGSYANKTNVRLDYDVDIAVECTNFFYYDHIDRTGAAVSLTKAAAMQEQITPYKGGYTSLQFKSNVEQALADYYGRSAVQRGNMAMRVREKKTTLPADVVPCFEYHLNYDTDSGGNLIYYKGTRVYPDNGSHIHNWPEQQRVNGISKNDATGRRYKRMVRALKRIENELAKAGTIGELPSFLMECLVYNCPNSDFNHGTYIADMREVLATIYNATLTAESCNEWLEVSGRKYLFRTSQSWTRQQAHELAGRAWTYMGLE